MKHGNLYWEIEITFGDSIFAEYCTRTTIVVRKYNFKNALREAAELCGTQLNVYDNTIVTLDVRLRRDARGPNAFEILKSWWLPVSPINNVPAKFFNDAQHCFKTLRCHR